MKLQLLSGLCLGLLPLTGQAQHRAAPVPAKKVEYYNSKYLPVATKAEASSWVETIYQDSIRAVRLTYGAKGELTDSATYANVRLKKLDGPRVSFYSATGRICLRERYRADTLLSRLAYYEDGKLRREEEYDRKGQRALGKVYDQTGQELPFCEYRVLPAWPGGFTVFTQQVAGRTSYPLRSLLKEEQGRVLIGFVINQQGRMEDVHCLNPAEVPLLLQKEAVKKVRNMPAHWTNGWQEGEPVSVSFTVPVTFKIQ